MLYFIEFEKGKNLIEKADGGNISKNAIHFLKILYVFVLVLLLKNLGSHSQLKKIVIFVSNAKLQ